MSDLFYEDYFQRVVNVNWDTEPECYFMVGDGGNLLDNMEPYGGGNIWRSDDGINWSKVLDNLGYPHGAVIGGLTCGVWMRQYFNPKAAPIWVMGGQRTGSEPGTTIVPAIAYSFDSHGVTVRDQGTDPETVWTMAVNGPALAPVNVSADLLRFLTITRHIYTIDGENWGDDPTAAPPLPPKTKIKNTRALYQLANRNTAYGKVREGQFKGRTLVLTGLGGDAHRFTSSIKATDQKTGKLLGVFNSGIQFGRSLAYGHYTFCITGGLGAGEEEEQGGYVAWSADGYTWHKQRLSDLELWPLVIGPRK